MHKNEIIIFGACLFFILIGAYLLFQPVHAPVQEAQQPAPATTVSFSVLASGNAVASIPARKNVRVTNSDELASAWIGVYGKKSAPPAVDFSKNEVYAIYDGTHSTAGYAVSVKKIEEMNGTRVVTIVHAEPNPTCVVAQTTTSPFEFIVVPITVATLTHEDETTIAFCK